MDIELLHKYKTFVSLLWQPRVYSHYPPPEHYPEWIGNVWSDKHIRACLNGYETFRQNGELWNVDPHIPTHILHFYINNFVCDQTEVGRMFFEFADWVVDHANADDNRLILSWACTESRTRRTYSDAVAQDNLITKRDCIEFWKCTKEYRSRHNPLYHTQPEACPRHGKPLCTHDEDVNMDVWIDYKDFLTCLN